MAFHHKYLAKKSYHVLNEANQAAVAEAEAKQATLARRVEERKKLLEKERAVQRHQEELIQGGHAKPAPTKTSVAFLYEPPPGFVPAPPPPMPVSPPRVLQEPSSSSGSQIKSEGLTEIHDLTKVEPVEHSTTSSLTRPPLPPSSSTYTPFSTSATVSLLPVNAPPVPAGVPIESYAARRERHRGMTVAQIREELHPATRGAPVTGEYVRQNAAFKPKMLGVVLRDTRCVRCGGVGHASVDRECPRFNDNPADISRQVREDPMTKLRAINAAEEPKEAVAGGAKGQFKLVYNDEAYTVGGYKPDDPLQQVILLSDDDDIPPQDSSHARRRKRTKRESSHQHAPGSDPSTSATSSTAALTATSALTPDEATFLSTLSSEDMRLLLKQLKKKSSSSTPKRDRKSSKREKKSKKKTKEEKKKSSSSRHSSSSSNGRPKRHKRSRSSSSSSASSSSSSSSSASDSEMLIHDTEVDVGDADHTRTATGPPLISSHGPTHDLDFPHPPMDSNEPPQLSTTRRDSYGITPQLDDEPPPLER